jgi:glutamyl-tRNA synthetase
MITLFDIARVNKAASAFNPEKLLWLNQQHMMRSAPEAIVPYLKPHLARLGIKDVDDAFLGALVLAQRERVKTLKEMAEASRYFFGETVSIDPKSSVKHLTLEAITVLGQLSERLSSLGDWSAPAIHEAIKAIAEDAGVGLGKVAQPLRVAVTGGTVSPPIDQTLAMIGRDRSLARLAAVLHDHRST